MLKFSHSFLNVPKDVLFINGNIQKDKPVPMDQFKELQLFSPQLKQCHPASLVDLVRSGKADWALLILSSLARELRAVKNSPNTGQFRRIHAPPLPSFLFLDDRKWRGESSTATCPNFFPSDTPYGVFNAVNSAALFETTENISYEWRQELAFSHNELELLREELPQTYVDDLNSADCLLVLALAEAAALAFSSEKHQINVDLDGFGNQFVFSAKLYTTTLSLFRNPQSRGGFTDPKLFCHSDDGKLIHVKNAPKALDLFGISGENSSGECLDQVRWADILWALCSETQEQLLKACSLIANPVTHRTGFRWKLVKGFGIPLWLKSDRLLRSCLEQTAHVEYLETKNPFDVFLYYVVLGRSKLPILTSLFNNGIPIDDTLNAYTRKLSAEQTAALKRRLQRDRTTSKKVASFLEKYSKSNPVTDKLKKACGSNALSLLSQHRHFEACAFFLLAHRPKDAIQVCLRQLNEPLLALCIARIGAYEWQADSEQVSWAMGTLAFTSSKDFAMKASKWSSRDDWWGRDSPGRQNEDNQGEETTVKNKPASIFDQWDFGTDVSEPKGQPKYPSSLLDQWDTDAIGKSTNAVPSILDEWDPPETTPSKPHSLLDEWDTGSDRENDVRSNKEDTESRIRDVNPVCVFSAFVFDKCFIPLAESADADPWYVCLVKALTMEAVDPCETFVDPSVGELGNCEDRSLPKLEKTEMFYFLEERLRVLPPAKRGQIFSHFGERENEYPPNLVDDKLWANLPKTFMRFLMDSIALSQRHGNRLLELCFVQRLRKFSSHPIRDCIQTSTACSSELALSTQRHSITKIAAKALERQVRGLGKQMKENLSSLNDAFCSPDTVAMIVLRTGYFGDDAFFNGACSSGKAEAQKYFESLSRWESFVRHNLIHPDNSTLISCLRREYTILRCLDIPLNPNNPSTVCKASAFVSGRILAIKYGFVPILLVSRALASAMDSRRWHSVFRLLREGEGIDADGTSTQSEKTSIPDVLKKTCAGLTKGGRLLSEGCDILELDKPNWSKELNSSSLSSILLMVEQQVTPELSDVFDSINDISHQSDNVDLGKTGKWCKSLLEEVLSLLCERYVIGSLQQCFTYFQYFAWALPFALGTLNRSNSANDFNEQLNQVLGPHLNVSSPTVSKLGMNALLKATCRDILEAMKNLECDSTSQSMLTDVMLGMVDELQESVNEYLKQLLAVWRGRAIERLDRLCQFSPISEFTSDIRSKAVGELLRGVTQGEPSNLPDSSNFRINSTEDACSMMRFLLTGLPASRRSARLPSSSLTLNGLVQEIGNLSKSGVRSPENRMFERFFLLSESVFDELYSPSENESVRKLWDKIGGNSALWMLFMERWARQEALRRYSIIDVENQKDYSSEITTSELVNLMRHQWQRPSFFIKPRIDYSECITFSSIRRQFISNLCLNPLDEDCLAISATEGVFELYLHDKLNEKNAGNALDLELKVSMGVAKASRHYPSNYNVSNQFMETPVSPNTLSADDNRTSIFSSNNERQKKDITRRAAVTRLDHHPWLPYYASAGVSGQVLLWKEKNDYGIARYRQNRTDDHENVELGKRMTSIHWSPTGDLLAATDVTGGLWIWQSDNSDQPVHSLQAHSVRASDFVFLNDASVIAVVGSSNYRTPATHTVLSTENRSKNNVIQVCDLPPHADLGESNSGPTLSIIDTRVQRRGHRVISAYLHPTPAYCCAYDETSRSLISCGQKGEVTIFDLRMDFVRKRVVSPPDDHGNHKPIKCISLDTSGNHFATGSNDGSVHIWDLKDPDPNTTASMKNLHPEQTLFSHRLTDSMISHYGTTDVLFTERHLLTAGANGVVNVFPKVWM